MTLDEYINKFGHAPGVTYTEAELRELGATTVEWNEIFVAADGRVGMTHISRIYDANGNLLSGNNGFAPGSDIGGFAMIDENRTIQYKDTVISETTYQFKYLD